MAKRRKILGWIEKPSPNLLKKGEGWFGELDRVYVDNDKKYCVMTRELDTDMGRVTHACIRSAGSKQNNYNGEDIPWAEKQRIKNQIFGNDVAAIEVFPKTDELVDQANMYHIWVLHDFELPFGIHYKQI